MKTKRFDFMISFIFVSVLVTSCTGNVKHVKVCLIDSTTPNSLAGVSVVNKSTRKAAARQNDSTYTIKARNGDEIRISSGEDKETIFMVNDVSSEYNVFLTAK